MRQVTKVVLVALMTLATTQALAQQASADTPWPTKAALLAAARAGEFKDYTNEYGDWRTQVRPLVNSVFAVLRRDYGVPPLPQDTACLRSASDEVARSILHVIKGVSDSVTRRPPDFRSEVRFHSELDTILGRAGTGGGFCEVQRGSSREPHPYGAAYVDLLQEFANVSNEWAKAESAKRKAAHQEQVARDQAAADKQRADQQRAEAERRAAEQRRIDAERARIEADEKRRREADKKRTAG